MRLCPQSIAIDNKKYGCRDVITELDYCGFDVPLRKDITNDNIRFYAWLCRTSALMLKYKDAEIKRLRDSLKNKLPPVKPDKDGESCRCGKCDAFIMRVSQTRVPINKESVRFCSHCGNPIDWQEWEYEWE